MRNKILLLTILLVASMNIYSQKSTTIKVTHMPGYILKDGKSVLNIPDWELLNITNTNCFSFLSFKIFAIAADANELIYEYRFSITNNSPTKVFVIFHWYSEGSGNGDYIESGQTKSYVSLETEREYPSIKIRNIQFRFDKIEQDRYGVSLASKNLNCDETYDTYVNKSKGNNEFNANSNNNNSNNNFNSNQSNKTYTVAEIAAMEQAAKNKTSTTNFQENSSDAYDYSSSENSSNSYNTPSESSFQKKQRKDAEAREAQQRARQNAQRQADAQVASNNRRMNQMEQAATEFENGIDNIINQYSANLAAERRKSDAQYERELAKREADQREQRRINEERKRENLRAERKRAEEKRISNAQSNFLESINDHKMPVAVNKKEVYFIIISRKYNEEKIYLSPFTLYANNENELPYKVDVIKDYKSKISRPYVYIQGPYNSFEEQKSAITTFQSKAKNNYISHSLMKFTYTPKYENTNTQNSDFWGEKKAKDTKSKVTESIWD